MKATDSTLPGLERIRAHFLERLATSYQELSTCVIDALNTANPDSAGRSLTKASTILHKISGSAGSLGFEELGDAARRCEASVLGYLDTSTRHDKKRLEDVAFNISDFVYDCIIVLDA